MKRFILMTVLAALTGVANADDVSDAKRLLCSASELLVCLETGDCAPELPWEVGVPQFVVIDIKKKLISTTKASNENRSTPIGTISQTNDEIFLQGVEAGRAFSFVIDKLTGLLTVAVARDGFSVSVFGACTDADI